MNFLSSSLRIGTLFGIEVRVHMLFVLWIAYRLVAYPGDWQDAAVRLAVLFSIVLLHEFGHCFGARAVGGEARQILMWPLGGLAYASAPPRPWPQFVTVAAGPAVNVLICLLASAVLYLAVPGPVALSLNPLGQTVLLSRAAPDWAVHVGRIYDASFFLLAFNLLPIYPLDGGQIAQAILWPFIGLQRSLILACYVGLAGCAFLGLVALRGGAGVLLFIALFGAMVCWQRLKAARMGLLAEEFGGAGYGYRPRRSRGFWSRWKRSSRGPVPGELGFNPNPGGWDARRAERERLEAEVDRILKKVSERGLQSLTYVERQTLEQARRLREQEEGS